MLTKELKHLINKTVKQSNFSGVISIEENGQVFFEEAFGYADRSNKIENQLDTRFAIASGAKFFTALGIGKLID